MYDKVNYFIWCCWFLNYYDFKRNVVDLNLLILWNQEYPTFPNSTLPTCESLQGGGREQPAGPLGGWNHAIKSLFQFLCFIFPFSLYFHLISEPVQWLSARVFAWWAWTWRQRQQFAECTQPSAVLRLVGQFWAAHFKPNCAHQLRQQTDWSHFRNN